MSKSNPTATPVSDLKKFARAIRDAIKQGYAPPGVNPGGGKKSSVTIAADTLGMTKGKRQGRLDLIRQHGLQSTWAAAEKKWNADRDKPAKPIDAPESIDERVRERRLEREIAELKAERRGLLDRIVDAEDLRASVFHLASQIEAPAIIKPAAGTKKGGKRSAILHISDVHNGEFVDLHEMDGLNSYNDQICRARLERLFQKVASLLSEHWKGDPPEEMILCLGGDMVDNNLREESRRGGSLPVVPSIKLVSEWLAGGIKFLRAKLKIPIRVYTSPGNHGRLTLKPHINEGAIDNLDQLVSFAVESMLASDRDVNFLYSGSGETLFNVYGWKFLLQHGHEGAAGTGGLYGPVYKQVRGMYRAHVSYARRGRPFHFVLQGHDHTPSALPFGFANGSVVGYNPYAMRKLKADPSPAVQNLLIVEERLGVITHAPIYLGVPSEGSLYEPPVVDLAGTLENAA